MADTSKPQVPQVDTQVQQQQVPGQQQQQAPGQQQQQAPGQQQQQAPQQQQQVPQQQPFQQQQLNTPQTPYQQQPYAAPTSPHMPPQGSPQPGYAQMPPSSPGGYQLPPAGYPQPQQGFQYPPQQFPPQGYAYPPQVGYPPQQPGYPPQGMPPQQYPAPYQQPGYPPQQPGYPPQQPGYPPQQPGYAQQYAPTQSPYDSNNPWMQPMAMGMPGQYGAPILKPVSSGYTPGELAPNYNPKADAEVIRKALSGGSVDEQALIHIIPLFTPQQLESIRHVLLVDNRITLSELLDRVINSSFDETVRACVLGPLDFDVYLLKKAFTGVVKTPYLDMVLLSRKNGDIEAIKTAYHKRYNKHLIDEVRSNLRGEVEALFMNTLEARRADEAVPVDNAQVGADVKELYAAMVGRSEGNRVSEILVTRSDAQIKKIVEMYQSNYKVKSLEEVIKKKFSGHMEDALLYIIRGAKDKAQRDAMYLEKTMKGLGTKSEELSYRLAVLHWDKEHMKNVKAAYKKEFPKKESLAARVKGETSGQHQKLLLALIDVA